MEQTWRWFGPDDVIRLADIRQAGATGIVTALHQIPYGVVWSVDEIEKRKALIGAEPSLGLSWSVVESLPVHEAIKIGEGDLDPLFDNYRQSLRNLAACGIGTVCYNFMPVLDWTRTELAHPLPGGGRALRFDAPVFAAFDCFMLERSGAEADHPPEGCRPGPDLVRPSVGERQANTPCDDHGRPARRLRPLRHSGPEAHAGPLPRGAPRAPARKSRAVSAAGDPDGRRNRRPNGDPPRRPAAPPHGPAQDRLGRGRSCLHRGSHRLAGERDHAVQRLPRCGDPQRRAGDRAPLRAELHFAHLRNVAKEPDGSFMEADHLGGDTDMVALVDILLGEQKRRRDAGDPRWRIPMRPDHGHELLDDIGKATHPGYPMIGRLKGLAELRGVMQALAAIRGLPL